MTCKCFIQEFKTDTMKKHDMCSINMWYTGIGTILKDIWNYRGYVGSITDFELKASKMSRKTHIQYYHRFSKEEKMATIMYAWRIVVRWPGIDMTDI